MESGAILLGGIECKECKFHIRNNELLGHQLEHYKLISDREFNRSLDIERKLDKQLGLIQEATVNIGNFQSTGDRETAQQKSRRLTRESFDKWKKDNNLVPISENDLLNVETNKINS